VLEGRGNYIYEWPPLNVTCDDHTVLGTDKLSYQLVKVFPAFMQTIISLPCFHGPVTELIIKPVESNPFASYV
jgi:hypothetical protein